MLSSAMPHDDYAAATRKDLRILEKKMATKKDLQELRTEAKKDLREMEERLVQHFNVVAENLVHDFKGIFKDRLEQHEDRIVRLEQHVGIA